MYTVRNILIWLRRSRHSLGFGVQSPFAFNFITDVVNEHYSYYSYNRLNDTFPLLNKKNGKLSKLYFRLANYCQPKYVLNYYPESDAYSDYIKAGCSKSSIVTITDESDEFNMFRVDMVIMSLDGNYEEFFYSLLDKITIDSLVVIQGIKQNKKAKKFWKKVIDDDRVGITFDLYYAGIVFFNKERFKQNYIVNF